MSPRRDLDAVGVRVERVPDPRPVTVAAKGGGKGGGGASTTPHQPDVAPDTLRSKATVRILELLSEGPVAGAHDAPLSLFQSVFLDGTPVVDQSGITQFTIKEGFFRQGWPAQDPIPGYPLAEAPFSVGVQMHT